MLGSGIEAGLEPQRPGANQDPGEDSMVLDSGRVNKEERKVRADSITKGRTGRHARGER